jgi:hypothetical protein
MQSSSAVPLQLIHTSPALRCRRLFILSRSPSSTLSRCSMNFRVQRTSLSSSLETLRWARRGEKLEVTWISSHFAASTSGPVAFLLFPLSHLSETDGPLVPVFRGGFSERNNTRDSSLPPLKRQKLDLSSPFLSPDDDDSLDWLPEGYIEASPDATAVVATKEPNSSDRTRQTVVISDSGYVCLTRFVSSSSGA